MLTEDEKEVKQCEINGLKNLLQQQDYMARKVTFEVAAFIKQAFPDAELPAYDQYCELEEKADTFRAQINVLESELADNT